MIFLVLHNSMATYKAHTLLHGCTQMFFLVGVHSRDPGSRIVALFLRMARLPIWCIAGSSCTHPARFQRHSRNLLSGCVAGIVQACIGRTFETARRCETAAWTAESTLKGGENPFRCVANFEHMSGLGLLYIPATPTTHAQPNVIFASQNSVKLSYAANLINDLHTNSSIYAWQNRTVKTPSLSLQYK